MAAPAASASRCSERFRVAGGQPSLGWASNGWLFFLGPRPATSVVAWPPGGPAAGRVWLDADQGLDAIPRALAPN